MTTETLNPADAGPSTPQSQAQRITVWDVPTRVFHWTLAASFAGAFLTAESERWRNLHVMLGYTLIGLIIFRLVWGFVGTRHARFADFAAGPARVFSYLKSLLSGQPQHHVGHNPAGALAIFALIGLGLVVGLSGLLNYNEIGGEWIEDLHEGAANAMLAVVAIHVLGVVVSSFMHRENLVGAMFSGKKRGAPEEGIGVRHRLLGILLLLAVLGFWFFWTTNPAPGGAAGTTNAASAAPWSGDLRGGERKRHREDD